MLLSKARLFALVLACAALLAACDTAPTTSTPLPNTTSDLIRWTRTSEAIVFRADIHTLQGEPTFGERGGIAECTIYGDNRVVWLNDGGGGQIQVLYDQLTDAAIIDFVVYLNSQRLPSYAPTTPTPAPIDPDATADTSDTPTPTPTSEPTATPDPNLTPTPGPVVASLELNISQARWFSTEFDGWPSDYYARITDICKKLSQAPTLFEPTGAWFSAQVADPNGIAPRQNWNADSGISLQRLAESGQRQWVTGLNAVELWRYFRSNSSDTRFVENGIEYRVALEVPGVMRFSPPAP
jgi:hypothetical protein